MFRRLRRRRSRDPVPTGGIEAVVQDTEAGPEPEAVPEDDAPAEASGAVPMDPELARQCTESRQEAERRMRADDQRRQTVFACACVVAGFCGITGVIFGTAAVCGRIGQPQQYAVAGPPGIVAGAQQDQEAWYDAGGRLHVNVHITREPDRELNIYIDQDGNVTTDPPETAEPEGGEGQDGQEDGNGTTAPPDDTGQPDGGADEGGNGGGDGENQDADPAPKTEDDLLAEMQARKDAGGSGYTESDVQYVVRYGDTLSAISNRTGFSVDFLAAYNGIRDKNLIITGEVLRYPSFTPSGG